MTSKGKMDVKERIEYSVSLNAALLERSGYSEEAYCRVVLNAMVATPAIAECDVASLQQALLDAMNAGLVPDGKESAIVPFKGKAQLIIMIEGRMKLAHQAIEGPGGARDGRLRGGRVGLRRGPPCRPQARAQPRRQQRAGGSDLRLRHRSPAGVYGPPVRCDVPRHGGPIPGLLRQPHARAVGDPLRGDGEERRLEAAPQAAAQESSHAPVEAPELELVDTLEDAAALGDDGSRSPALGGGTVDTATGEITDAPEPEPTPIRRPSSTQAAFWPRR